MSSSAEERLFTPPCNKKLQSPLKVAQRHCRGARALCTPCRHLVPRHEPRRRQPRCCPLRARSPRPRLHTRRCLGPRVARSPDHRRLGPSPPSLRDALRPHDPATQPTSRLPCWAELSCGCPPIRNPSSKFDHLSLVFGRFANIVQTAALHPTRCTFIIQVTLCVCFCDISAAVIIFFILSSTLFLLVLRRDVGLTVPATPLEHSQLTARGRQGERPRP